MNLARRPAAFSAVLITAGALGAGVALAAGSGDQDPAFNHGAAPAVVDFPDSDFTTGSSTGVAVGPDDARDLAARPRRATSCLRRDLRRHRPARPRLVRGGSTRSATTASRPTRSRDLRNTGPRVVAVDPADNTLVGFSSGDERGGGGPVDTLWGNDGDGSPTATSRSLTTGPTASVTGVSRAST